MKLAYVVLLLLATTHVAVTFIVKDPNDDTYEWRDVSKEENSVLNSVCMVLSSDHVNAKVKNLRHGPKSLKHALTLQQNFDAGYLPQQNRKRELLCSDIQNLKSHFTAGTGFVVGAHRLVTARHVVTDALKEVYPDEEVDELVKKHGKDLRGKIFCVFGQHSLSNHVEIIPIRSVTADGGDADYVVLAPEVPFDNEEHPHLELDTDYEPEQDDKVFTLGFPLGLPMKVSYGQVEMPAYADDEHVSARVSLFEGNSGGPLFQLGKSKVIGMTKSGADIDTIPNFERGPTCLAFQTVNPADATWASDACTKFLAASIISEDV